MNDKALEQMFNKYKKEVRTDLVRVQNRLYSQLESLSWLQKRLSIVGQLPSLRGWAASPDLLLKIHTYIMYSKPNVVVELGSGATTIVIADALRQNGFGYLISIDHSYHYANQTLDNLSAENLTPWVDLRVGELEPWKSDHMNSGLNNQASSWYPLSLLKNIEGVNLLLVDGPPGATCQFARYPALPALFDRLAENAQVWMDDTIRQEEKDICQRWSEDYNFNFEYIPFEKGLGVLSR